MENNMKNKELKWIDYIRVRVVIPCVFVCDEKEEPQGATMASGELFITVKAQAALSTTGEFVRAQALDG